MIVCVAMQTGRSHDWVLDALSLPQVFLYWDNLGIVSGVGKRPKKRHRPRRDDAHEWVWNRAKREYEPFREERQESYEWNDDVRQWETDGD